MKRFLTTTRALALTTGALTAGMAAAGGVDRSGQSIGIIFEQGNYVELSYGRIMPDVSGTDLFGADTQSVAGDHGLPGLAMKYQFTDKMSFTLIYGQDYGADIHYPTAADGGSLLLGGTSASLDSDVLTGILRYHVDDNWSVHGGVRASRASGEVTLDGGAYGALAGYNVTFDKDWGFGYLVGAAYEIPDIALRVAITYFSEIGHEFDTTEYFPAALGGSVIATPTPVDTPQSVNIDFQSGIAADTLLFGSIRWVDWSNFTIAPQALSSSLTDLEDSTTWTLGVGRKFTENWSGSVFATYEDGSDGAISPLAPNNGYKGIGLGVVYTQDNMKISLGARYLDIGDAAVGPAGNRVSDFADNHAIAVGMKVGFSF